MQLKGSTSTATTRENKVGFVKATLAELNPTRKELNKLMGIEDNDDDKEMEYLKDKDGVGQLQLSFWFSDEKGGLYNGSFFLKDEDEVSEKSGKTCYINQTGATQWVADESELMQDFTHFVKLDGWITPDGEKVEKWVKGARKNIAEVGEAKEYRIAKKGEFQLFKFLTQLMIKSKLNSGEVNALLNTKKLFQENLKQFTELLNPDTFYDTFTAMLYVQVKDGDDGETKYYQKIYLDNILGAGAMKQVNNGTVKSAYGFERLKESLEGEYGVKGFYDRSYGPAKPFNPEDVEAETANSSDTSASY